MDDLLLAIPSHLATAKDADIIYTFAGAQALTNYNFHLMDKGIVTPGMLAMAVLPGSTNGRERAKAALDRLRAMGLASRGPDGSYVFDRDSFTMMDSYVAVQIADLKAFVGARKNSAELFSYYICVLSTRSAESGFKVGRMPQTYLAEKFGVTATSAARYNKALEEMGLLYIRRLPPTRLTKERQTNVYGAARDRVDIDARARSAANTGRAVNEARRISAQYNAFVKKGGEGYSAKRIERLRIDCERYNELVKARGSGELKDMSVFEPMADNDVTG